MYITDILESYGNQNNEIIMEEVNKYFSNPSKYRFNRSLVPLHMDLTDYSSEQIIAIISGIQLNIDMKPICNPKFDPKTIEVYIQSVKAGTDISDFFDNPSYRDYCIRKSMLLKRIGCSYFDILESEILKDWDIDEIYNLRVGLRAYRLVKQFDSNLTYNQFTISKWKIPFIYDAIENNPELLQLYLHKNCSSYWMCDCIHKYSLKSNIDDRILELTILLDKKDYVSLLKICG